MSAAVPARPVPRRRWLPAALLAGLLVAVLSACVMVSPPPEPTSPPGTTAPTAPGASAATLPGPPAEPREFRAAWVATVANIDWPSQPGLPAQALQREALAILDRAVDLRLNALILQVRPAADAIFPSQLEPWSEYLSGTQGRGPWAQGEAAWDPLAFWLREAHARGLELHVWFNPYRARHMQARSAPAASHVSVRAPQLVRRYGDLLWMDPGEPEAAAHTLAVVADVLRRYDVDGVHIDDYFYPYPANDARGNELPFPDEASYRRYRATGGTLALEDWRRANVDTLVQALYRTAREIRPLVRVGISPFGLGRPDRRPPGVVGFSQYDKLYADVERWLAEGWLDYLAPQLYWAVGSEGQPFAPLLDTWLAENTRQRHVWPGLFTSRIIRREAGERLGERVWLAQEVVDQVMLTRSRPAAGGHIHFSMTALMADRDGVATRLREGPYAQAALAPATPWLDKPPPPAPKLRQTGADQVQVLPGAGEAAARWAVWRQVQGQWRFAVQAPGELQVTAEGAELLAVAAVDRVGNLSPYFLLKLK